MPEAVDQNLAICCRTVLLPHVKSAEIRMLGATFRAWHAVAERTALLREASGRTLWLVGRRRLASALTGWQRVTERRRESRELLRAVQSRCQPQFTSVCMLP